MTNIPRLLALAALGVSTLTSASAGHVAGHAPAGQSASSPAGQVSRMSAHVSGGEVTLSGWATFSGAVIASGTSPVGNATLAGQPDPTAGPDGADLIGAQLIYRPELADLFMRWQVASSCANCGIPSVGTAPAEIVGDPLVLYGLRTEVAGIPIEIRVQSTGIGAEFGVFICNSEVDCTPGPSLQGGYGTTGEEIVVDIPLATLATAVGHPVGEGSQIGAPLAYTARAPYDAGVVVPQLEYIDTISMAHTATVTIPVKSVRVTVGRTTKTVVLNDGYFNVSFPRADFPHNPTTVTTRTCLGSACVVQQFSVQP